MHRLIGAINKRTQQYELPSVAVKTDCYQCPDCNGDLILNKGNVRKHHFKHKTTVECTYYEHPSESQMHKDAKFRLQSLLQSNVSVVMERQCHCFLNPLMRRQQMQKNCTGPSPTEQFEIPVPGSASEIVTEYRFEHNGELKIADVAYVENGKIVAIFEILHTHKTSDDARPEPWFEIESTTLLDLNPSPNPTEIILPCARKTFLETCTPTKCPRCLHYEPCWLTEQNFGFCIGCATECYSRGLKAQKRKRDFDDDVLPNTKAIVMEGFNAFLAEQMRQIEKRNQHGEVEDMANEDLHAQILQRDLNFFADDLRWRITDGSTRSDALVQLYFSKIMGTIHFDFNADTQEKITENRKIIDMLTPFLGPYWGVEKDPDQIVIHTFPQFIRILWIKNDQFWNINKRQYWWTLRCRNELSDPKTIQTTYSYKRCLQLKQGCSFIELLGEILFATADGVPLPFRNNVLSSEIPNYLDFDSQSSMRWCDACKRTSELERRHGDIIYSLCKKHCFDCFRKRCEMHVMDF